MSSSCSSIDLGIDPDFEDLLADSLLNDIELFAEHSNRLRVSLDSNAYIPDGESRCVQVHAALSMVSQSVRDLLVRYPIFKTSQVLIPASQLVHSVKELNFDSSVIDSARTLQCIEKLEAAVGNTLRQSV
uniref:Rho GTPase-activating protein 29/45 N-terminal domain-containing protein n=1 Tax=Panagrolaimus superbus TaxID=310955 RepID=A0A914YZF9_9BILA